MRLTVKDSRVSIAYLILVDLATGGVHLEVRFPGTAQGSDVQMSDPDGGQRGLDRSFGLGVSIFLERLSNSIDKGFYAVVLPDGAHHLEGVLIDASGEPLIINTRNSGHELILIKRNVMAVEDQRFHWSRSLGIL